MSESVLDAAAWQTANAEHLAAALHWLRLRLLRRAPVASAGEAPPSRGLFGRAPAPQAGRAPEVSEDELRGAEARLRERSATIPPPALELLARRFGLLPFERDILLLCAAMELDTRLGALCARAQDDPTRAHPTFALALALFDEPVWDALSPERPLRYWRLIEIAVGGGQPLTTSALRADERLVAFLKGLNYLDERLAPLLLPMGAQGDDEADLPPSLQATLDTIATRLARTPGAAPLVQLVGPDSSSKRLVVRRAASALGLHAYRLPASVLPTASGDVDALARLWQRESLLLPLLLYVDAHEADKPGEPVSAPVTRFLARLDGATFLGTREAWPETSRATLACDVLHPTPAEQRALWAQALAGRDAPGELPARLGAQFSLGPDDVRALAREHEPEQLWQACLLRTRPRLDALAQRLEPRATWDDIVLPEPETRLLRRIAEQVRQRATVYDDWGFRRKLARGLGLSALFAGESGTGKTLAAEVMAADLELGLYRIDLSAVVSKYIGETEKNLRRLFDAAEDGGAILFFDEADALFGKRSEVKDSHDRYANIEINYLLQRMEAYRGLAILATNMKSALDTAFVRRLRFIVTFPFPGPAERRAMWRQAFPAETPVADLDFERLARFSLTGGHIYNIALHAAFLAAQARAPVSMPLVLEAARTEFRKLEKPVNEAEFRWEGSAAR
jgi:hypothetical protein